MSTSTLPTEATLTSVLHASLAITPPKIVKADGNYLTTSDGYKIFDASGGAAVACIGHNHPYVRQATKDHLSSGVSYVFSPWFSTAAYESLSTFLTESTGGAMSKVFVVGSGAEAVEAMLKMARQFFVEKEGPRTERRRFISRDRSYHGNTLGSLSLSGHKARRTIYEPMLGENFSFVSPCYAYRGKRDAENDEMYVERLAQELEDEFQRLGPATVAAVVLETVSGLTLGGVVPVPGYLKAMKAVCDRHGALFCLDEVFAGMGRTGTLHAWGQEGVVPHLQTVAKGLGAGYAPIGALLVGKDVVDVLDRGSKAFVHFQTYHGHPVACAAALAVQRVIRDEKLVENCRVVGAYLGEQLTRKFAGHRYVGDVRGRGMVWAVEFVRDKATKEPFPVAEKVAPRIHQLGLTRKYGISLLPGGGVADGVNGDIMVVAPAYNITREDADFIVETARRVVAEVLGSEKESRL